MVYANNLRAMPPRHQFAQGDGTFPELGPDPVRWLAEWSGADWCLYVAPASHNFKEVRLLGKIVDGHLKKLIFDILPASEDALALYRK